MENKLLQKFQSGRPSLGTFTHLKSMVAVECLGLTGLDYVIIDMEHSPISIDEAARYMTAAQSGGITPLVRIHEITRSAVLQALDAGAQGLIVPCVETVAQARQLVEYAKFQPVGDRGYCMTRDGAWGFGPSYAGGMAQYMRRSNETTLLVPQCETVGCLEHIEEIVEIPGVDGILVGPFDLSIAMGMPGQFTTPAFQEALRRILKACKQAGKLAVVFSGSPADARAKLAAGFDSAAVGLDVLTLIDAYRNIVSQTLEESAEQHPTLIQ